MASSQVEIASSVFGCVLRDRNGHDRCSRESSDRVAAAFQKNLKKLVRDRLHAHISVSSDSSSGENADDVGHHHHKKVPRMANSQDEKSNSADNSSAASSKQARNLDQWAARQARQMVSTIEKQTEDAGLSSECPRTSTSTRETSQSSSAKPETPSGNGNLGASSLVQIWEARLGNNDPKTNRPCCTSNTENPATGVSRTSSSSSSGDSASSCSDEPSRYSDVGNAATNEEPIMQWEPTAQSAPASVHFRAPGAGGEREKVRIVDIIRKLTSDANEQEHQASGDFIPRELRHHPVHDQNELKTLPLVVSSPKIRGRQAFHDLLQQMEQERYREINSLVERHSVSKFNHRGRIQSMLRLRMLQRGMAIQDKQRSQSIQSTASSDSNRSQHGSSIMHLRERFNAGAEQATATTSASVTSRTSEHSVTVDPDASNTSTHSKKAKSNRVKENPTAQEHPAENSVSHKCEGNRVQGNSTTQQQCITLAENSTSLVREGNRLQDNSSTKPRCATQAENSKSSHNHLQESSGSRQQCAPAGENSVSQIREGSRLKEKSTAQKRCVVLAENSVSHTGESNHCRENSTNKKQGPPPAENSVSQHIGEGNHCRENSTNKKQGAPLAENSVSQHNGESNHCQENSTNKKHGAHLVENFLSCISEGNHSHESSTNKKQSAAENSVSQHIGESNHCQENSANKKHGTHLVENFLSCISEGNHYHENSTNKKHSAPIVENFLSCISEGHHYHESSTHKKQSAPREENSVSRTCGEHRPQENSTSQKQGLPCADSSVSHKTEANLFQENFTSQKQWVTEAVNSVTRKPEGNRVRENSDSRQQSVALSENSKSDICEGPKDIMEKINAASDNVSWQGLCSEVESLDRQETLETLASSDWVGIDIEEEAYEMADDDDQDYYGVTNYDWFSDIARPRSYWEDRRQAWYQEVLATTSENDERRKLLERRTVSSFLASDLRERIDQVMVSRVEMQAMQDDEELDEDAQERMGQLMLSYFQRHSHASESPQREEAHQRERETEEEHLSLEEAESQTSNYLDTATYFDQSSQSMRSPSPFRSWNYNDYHECSDDSERAPPTPPHPPRPSQASKQDRRFSSSTSTEIELIYDLKGQMEQLQREMLELRKSMQSCIEMQVSLHNFFKQEVHPVQVQGDRTAQYERPKGNRYCRICCEMQVDSFLYRCGHMCTCLKCAQELQRSGGRCPVCQASVLDVVQANTDA